jgi:hypothetical protein
MFLLLAACGTPSPHPIEDPLASNLDDRIIGKWKYEEDTNKMNFYEVTRSNVDKNQYHVKFWNRGGTNPTYEANIHLSDISGTKFINVPYWEQVADNGDLNDMVDKGFFFLKIIQVDRNFSRITTATVNDPALTGLKSKKEVKQYLSRNLNNPGRYSDTAHFYKVKK